MNQLKNKITNPFTSYDPSEFMPIYENGKLSNRSDFVTYKLRTAFWAYVDPIIEG